jgi:hypothetical protein
LRAVLLQWNDPKHTRNHRFRLIGNQDLSMFFNALQVYGRKLAKLDGLADGPAPAVLGLEEGPFTMKTPDDRDRHERSKLSLTALGQAVLAGREDFSRHNPIHRWWGGTELTSDRLWRWDPASQALIEPSRGSAQSPSFRGAQSANADVQFAHRRISRFRGLVPQSIPA